jgi:hypothetical protein
MGGMITVESDVPADMTLDEWKRTRRAATRPRRRTRLLDRVRNVGARAL